MKWVANANVAVTQEQRREIERKKQKRAEEAQKARERAAQRANEALEQAVPATDDHPYLVKKGVPAYGIWCGTWRGVPNTLLIPMRNSRGEVVSLQAIFTNKDVIGRGKDYPVGAQTKGCYFTIGKITYADNRPVIVIGEGYATAASVHLATGLCVAVAFTCGNLADVGRIVRRKFPDAVILFAADDDRWNDKNAGKIEAEAAAEAVGGLCVLPVFAIPSRDKSDNKTDFNDLHSCDGLDAVRDQIASKIKDAAQIVPRGPDVEVF